MFSLLYHQISSRFGKKLGSKWKVDGEGRSICWVCGIALPDDWCLMFNMEHGPYCMRHEDMVNGMHQRGIL